jgi:acyl carrier protein
MVVSTAGATWEDKVTIDAADAMSIEVGIEGFIANVLLRRARGVKVDPEQPLISSGLVDSLALLQLILFVEEEFGVVIRDGDVIVDNFETIRRIGALIAERRQP